MRETEAAMLRLSEAVKRYGVCGAETKKVVSELQSQFSIERDIAKLRLLKGKCDDAERRIRTQAADAGYNDINEEEVDRWYAQEVLVRQDEDTPQLAEKSSWDLILELIQQLEK